MLGSSPAELDDDAAGPTSVGRSWIHFEIGKATESGGGSTAAVGAAGGAGLTAAVGAAWGSGTICPVDLTGSICGTAN